MLWKGEVAERRTISDWLSGELQQPERPARFTAEYCILQFRATDRTDGTSFWMVVKLHRFLFILSISVYLSIYICLFPFSLPIFLFMSFSPSFLPLPHLFLLVSFFPSHFSPYFALSHATVAKDDSSACVRSSVSQICLLYSVFSWKLNYSVFELQFLCTHFVETWLSEHKTPWESDLIHHSRTKNY